MAVVVKQVANAESHRLEQTKRRGEKESGEKIKRDNEQLNNWRGAAVCLQLVQPSRFQECPDGRNEDNAMLMCSSGHREDEEQRGRGKSRISRRRLIAHLGASTNRGMDQPFSCIRFRYVF